MLNIICNILIVVFGITTTFLVGSKKKHIRRWAYPLGVLAQVPWLYVAIGAEQYGIVFASLMYGVLWIRGWINNWSLESDEWLD